MPEPVSIALGLYLAGYASLRAHARPSSAVSDEACAVQSMAARVGSRAEGSEALFGPKARILENLASLVTECAEANWDGYGAKPVDPWAVQTVEQIIRALPEGFPLPELAVEPDGEVSLDWIHSRYRRLSVSVGHGARLPYAWLDGADKGHAVSGFDGQQLPERLLAEVRRIMGISRVFPKAA